MIRRSLPKGSDIGLRSEQEVRKIQDWMNTYPRKILGGKTPLGRLKAGMGEGFTVPPLPGATAKMMQKACPAHRRH